MGRKRNKKTSLGVGGGGAKRRAFLIAQRVKNPTAMEEKQEIQFDSWVGKIPLEEGIA